MPADDAMFRLCQQLVTSHPAPAGGVANQGADLRSGSRLRSDRTSNIVGDVIFLLDRSGCHELLSVSAPEGKWRHPQHCKANVGAYNTVLGSDMPRRSQSALLVISS